MILGVLPVHPFDFSAYSFDDYYLIEEHLHIFSGLESFIHLAVEHHVDFLLFEVKHERVNVDLLVRAEHEEMLIVGGESLKFAYLVVETRNERSHSEHVIQ